ncbi:MAG TPA: ChaN family lipoprotein [Pyrinomonadaceae bacterium]|nr:ChaN family lipoprotein [Pyrinomonadaceae bacterium]
MKNLITFSISALLMTISIFGQQTNIGEANYRVYDRQGNASSLEKIIDSLKDVDVVFLGENHDDATAHYVQNEIFRRAFEKYGRERAVSLSLEMFERDVQTVLDEYLKDLISENHFLLSSRPWGNYKTDYKPLVEFAKTNRLEVIAANAPRRYVNMVSRSGRESLNRLSPEARRWLAPLPYSEASEAYAGKFNALMRQNSDSATPAKHNPMLNAQALWDATMAFSIAEYLKRAKNPLVVHLNGAFHTENRLGTPENLLKYAPKTRFLVVTMRYEENFTNFDQSKHADSGDFVILTDAKVPRSQR